MEYWEFLLQKEGDRSWLPLESPDVEILEGRYRVVARSSRANISVEIRITHQVADEVPPKRRAQKRFGRTNKDGLMVVFPFTRMKPGLWEIRCAGDLMSDFMGQSWQHNVCLQVLPQEFESETDWDPEWEMQDEEATDSSSSQSSLVVTTATATHLEPPLQHETASEPEPDVLTSEPEVTTAQSEATVEATSEASVEVAPEPVTPEGVNNTHQIPTHQIPATANYSVENYSVEQLQYLAKQISESEATLLPEVDLESAAIATPSPEIPEFPESSDTPAIAETTSAELDLEPSSEPIPADDFPVAPEGAGVAIPNTLDPAVEPPELENLPLQLVLAESAYMTSWGRPFTLFGRIELQEPESPTTAIANLPVAVRSGQGELQVCLRDPQSAQVLVEVRQPLTSQPLPYMFNCTIEIPLSCKTRLLLGEVIFHRPAITTDQAESATLHSADTSAVTQSFTLTADVDELLDAIAADLSENQLLDLRLSTEPSELESAAADSATNNPQSERAYLNLSFLNLGEQSQGKQLFHIQPSTGSPLPPQIYQSGQSEFSKTPALPVFQGFDPPATEPPVEVIAEAPETFEDSPEVALQPEVALAFLDLDSDLGDLGLADPEMDLMTTDSSETEASETEVSETEISETEPVATPDESKAPVGDTTSQALKFQERFWARLNALVSDADLSEWLREDRTDSSNSARSDEPAWETGSTSNNEVKAFPTHPGVPQPGEMIVHPTARSPEDQWVAQEIVVEDEPVVATPQPAEPEPEVLSPTLLHPDESVPNPQLEVPVGELVSGKPVTVRVRMPDLPCRIYVKFWVNDRQTRSLLDGPRWLVDFTPTGLGDLEATTQLTVPFGSLEIQFEAIAIEMATQRESHKVVATRMVVPPDTPTLSFPEWG
ncbi:MAG: hypothetical protein KME12_25375 [Trichocoleus desertorum ATA4-8-CV12]|jgi:hypothetical protein|nr:hypothetical protein [Trichocoleus desertorum ATA4-8-CV12]